MNLLPQASGARPRVACEITAQGVVAARSTSAGGPLTAVTKADLQAGAVMPGLKPGNIADRVHTVAMVRKVMEGVGLRGNARGADITLVIPDAAARVLLLEFESLPNKLSEALPLVRFRLKKLLPFEADDAMVTFQVMSHGKTLVRVLAVAMPRDVLAEYETAVREAGFDPGAVLPSTLAALAGTPDDESAVLVVNANRSGITTAIVREGILLLHRSVDLQEHGAGTPAGLPVALLEGAEAFHVATAYPAAGSAGAVAGADQHDLAEAVSVAAAYFEDTLSTAPQHIWSAGPLGAETLRRALQVTGVGGEDGLQVRELVEPGVLASDAVSASVPRGWLAGVAGALRG